MSLLLLLLLTDLILRCFIVFHLSLFVAFLLLLLFVVMLSQAFSLLLYFLAAM